MSPTSLARTFGNPTYLDMAQHYGTVVLPTRIRRPKDKSKVEVGVQVVERWILARLRNRKFFGLADLNQAIRKLLEELNDRTMDHLGKSRAEFFEELDRPALKALPAEPYEFAVWKKAKVHIDYHVEYEKHYYSVPYRLIGEKVFIRAAERTVEVFHPGQDLRQAPQGGVTPPIPSPGAPYNPGRAHASPGQDLRQTTVTMPSGPLSVSCAGRRISGLRPGG